MILLLASYGIPVLLMVASDVLGFDRGPEVVMATVVIVVYAFVGIGAPIASLWIFWLIWREPAAQRVSRKVARLAGILLSLTPPLAISVVAVGVFQTDDTGLGMFIAAFFIAPWAAIQILPGAIAFLRVAFQRLAPPERAGASSPTS